MYTFICDCLQIIVLYNLVPRHHRSWLEVEITDSGIPPYTKNASRAGEVAGRSPLADPLTMPYQNKTYPLTINSQTLSQQNIPYHNKLSSLYHNKSAINYISQNCIWLVLKNINLFFNYVFYPAPPVSYQNIVY